MVLLQAGQVGDSTSQISGSGVGVGIVEEEVEEGEGRGERRRAPKIPLFAWGAPREDFR
jgi:hypothetical protein